jgi:hypothetical protein
MKTVPALAALLLASFFVACDDAADPQPTPNPDEPQPAAQVLALSETPPAVPPPPVPSTPRSIYAGQWDIVYEVTESDCEEGLQAGAFAALTWEFREVDENNGLIGDQELITVHNADGAFVGRYQLVWPRLQFHVNLEDVGTVLTVFTFADDGTAVSQRDETWGLDPNDTCQVRMESLTASPQAD